MGESVNLKSQIVKQILESACQLVDGSTQSGPICPVFITWCTSGLQQPTGFNNQPEG